MFWDQQWKQIWFPEEIAVSKDVKQWSDFEHQDTYKKVLGGLTLLDTIQTNIGMNEIARYAPDLQEKALVYRVRLLRSDSCEIVFVYFHYVVHEQ